MRTRRQRLKKRKVKIVTLGCAKNLVDSEVMAAQLAVNDFEITYNEADTDAAIVIVNTCGFIDQAKAQSRGTIERYIHQKNRGQIERLYVSGCLSQRYPVQLAAEMPEVDGFFGTKDLPKLLESFGADFRDDLIGERMVSTSPHSAYLKISEGCNRSCSFCVIPSIRGKHISQPIEDLVNEAEKLVANGAKEIMLIAQDLTFYGKDLYGERRLNELLLRLSEIDSLEWLRLHYAHPASFPREILATMRGGDNICRYLDIPLQHISSRMLKTMRRSIDRAETEDLIQALRAEVPGIHIRSTFLTGHPGETEEDHAELMDFLATYRLERVGVFMYSDEEGTRSAEMGESVPDDVKQRRFDELMQQQQRISEECNRTKIGQQMRVLVDGYTKARLTGRTEFDSPEVDNEVLITGSGPRPGDFCNVEITDAREYDLIGRLV